MKKMNFKYRQKLPANGVGYALALKYSVPVSNEHKAGKIKQLSKANEK